MAEWQVHLEFVEGDSKKFWRGRVEGSSVTTNWGRIGSDGQSKTKDLGSSETAVEELRAQMEKKLKKGYVDRSLKNAITEPAPPKDDVATFGATLSLKEDGRVIELTLSRDQNVISTRVTETYDTADTARAAFARIKQKLVEDGYSESG